MGLFGKVMNLLYEEDGTASQPSQSSSNTVTQKTVTKNVQSKPIQKNIDSKVYKQFSESINAAMSAENLPGFDLYEFHQIFKQAVSSGDDVKSAFKKALSSSETMRVNTDSLVSNYDHYKKIIDNQKDGFDKDLEKFYNENIKNPKTSQESIENELNEKLEQLNKLEAEVQTLKEKRKSINLDTTSAENQMSEVKTAFNKAYDEINSELSGIIDILKSL